MQKVKITQLKSIINRSEKQKSTIKALGLGRPNYTTIKEVTPQINGMIKVVAHMVRVENLSE
jgi:large subunit ribosomal protein L30